MVKYIQTIRRQQLTIVCMCLAILWDLLVFGLAAKINYLKNVACFNVSSNTMFSTKFITILPHIFHNTEYKQAIMVLLFHDGGPYPIETSDLILRAYVAVIVLLIS